MVDLGQAIARAETLWPHMATSAVQSVLEILGASKAVAEEAVQAVLTRRVAQEAGAT